MYLIIMFDYNISNRLVDFITMACGWRLGGQLLLFIYYFVITIENFPLWTGKIDFESFLFSIHCVQLLLLFACTPFHNRWMIQRWVSSERETNRNWFELFFVTKRMHSGQAKHLKRKRNEKRKKRKKTSNIKSSSGSALSVRTLASFVDAHIMRSHKHHGSIVAHHSTQHTRFVLCGRRWYRRHIDGDYIINWTSRAKLKHDSMDLVKCVVHLTCIPFQISHPIPSSFPSQIRFSIKLFCQIAHN